MRLGEQLLIRAIEAGHNKVRDPIRVALAVATAELVELAVERRINLNGLHLVIEDVHPTGHGPCDATLTAMKGYPRSFTAAGWITKRGKQHLLNSYTVVLERQGVLEILRPADASNPARVELVAHAMDETTWPHALHEAYYLLAHAAGLIPARAPGPPPSTTPTDAEPVDRTPEPTALSIARTGARLVADPPKPNDRTNFPYTTMVMGGRSY